MFHFHIPENVRKPKTFSGGLGMERWAINRSIWSATSKIC